MTAFGYQHRALAAIAAAMVLLLLQISISPVNAKTPTHTNVKAYDFIGPFASGKTEIEGDPLSSNIMRGGGPILSTAIPLPKNTNSPGADHNCTRDQILLRRKGCPQMFYSELATGGMVGWSHYKVAANGDTQISFPTPAAPINFNTLVQTVSKMTVMEFQGWAVGRFKINQPGRYRIRLTPVHTFYLDDDVDTGIPLAGDIYRHDWSSVITNLKEGVHTLKIHLRAKQHAQFTTTITYIGEGVTRAAAGLNLHPLQVFPPDRSGETVGDLVEGSFPLKNQMVFALPLVNQGQQWLHDIKVEIQTIERNTKTKFPRIRLSPSHDAYYKTNPLRATLAPGAVIMLPVTVEVEESSMETATKDWWKAFRDKESCLSFRFTVSAALRDFPNEARLTDQDNLVQNPPTNGKRNQIDLKCREWDQSFVFTYRDDDGSAANAAAIRPRAPGACESSASSNGKKHGCPIVVSYSGVGVPSRNQADAYKYKPAGKNSYLFGFEAAWVLVPDRAGAHNDEGSMHLTALQAVVHLAATSLKTAPADHTRLIYAGHSRGGHGALMLAAHVPDMGVALSTAGGWGDREEYGDANILFDLDLQLAHMSPMVKSVLEASIMENDMHAHMANIVGMPTMVRLGSDDSTVPAFYTRRLARLLSEHGASVTFSELPNKQHWWWDTFAPEDGGVVHDIEMRTFIEAAISGKSNEALAVPDSFEVLSSNPSLYLEKNGFRIVQIQSKLLMAKLTVERKRYSLTEELASIDSNEASTKKPEVWHVTTSNTRRFTLHINERYKIRAAAASVFDNGVQIIIDGQEETRFTAFPIGCTHGQEDSTQKLDYERVNFPFEGETHFCLVEFDSGHDHSVVGEAWRICTDSASKYQRELKQRGPLNYGPMRQVFQDPADRLSALTFLNTAAAAQEVPPATGKPFVIIVGTSHLDPAVNEALLDLARYLSLGHAQAVSTTAPVIRDTDISYDTLHSSHQNIILLGGPEMNSIARRWAKESHLSVDLDVGHGVSASFAMNRCIFDHPSHAVAFLNPFEGISNWNNSNGQVEHAFPTHSANNLVLMLAGNSIASLSQLIRFEFAVNTPLTRAPFTNMYPDYVITSDTFAWKGSGGLAAAGYFDYRWRFDPAQGFVACKKRRSRSSASGY